MKLVENWSTVLLKSWSVWILFAISLISAAQSLFGSFTADQLGLSPQTYAAIITGLGVLGMVARILNQGIAAFLASESGAMSRRAMGVTVAALVAASAAFVAPWEGLRTQAYRDAVGVWTVCYGETKGVRPGDAYTPAECSEMLERELAAYGAGLGKCLKAELPTGAAVAFVSWSYNVGVGAACRSTLVRKANAGDLFGACDELLKWDKGRIGGELVRIPGLTNRRRAERDLCVRSLIGAGFDPAGAA